MHNGVVIRVTLLLIVAMLVDIFGTGFAQAEPVTIVNHSFESPILSNGTFDRGPILGWVSPADPANDDTGVYNAPATVFPDEAPDGENVAFIGGSAFFIAQPITQTLSSNLNQGSYDLRVDVGDRLDTTFAGYLIELRAGATVLAVNNNSLTPADGEFVTAVLTYTSLPTNPNLGQPLAIRLLALTPGSGQQTDFDDVRLDFAPLSELPPGDFNDDERVDAADYVAWRKNVGAPAGTLPNDIDGGQIGPEQYDTWLSHFGESLSDGGGSAHVPEPASAALCAVFALNTLNTLRRRF